MGFALPAGLIAHRQFSLDPLTLERPEPHWAVVVAVVCLLALLTSAGEELLWRVALLYPLRDELPFLATALASAASFGLAHQSGIPRVVYLGEGPDTTSWAVTGSDKTTAGPRAGDRPRPCCGC